MREKQIVLEDVAEPPPLRRHVDAALAVEKRKAVHDDRSALRTRDTRQRVHEAGLARARAAEEPDDRRLGAERDVEAKRAKPFLDVDRDHDFTPRKEKSFRRAIHSAATSAATESSTAIAERRHTCASAPGTCVKL